MQMKLKYIFTAVAAALMLSGCDGNNGHTPAVSSSMFLRKTNPGIYQGPASLFTFTKTDHQLYVNTTTNTYRMLTDEGDKYVQVVLDSPIPGMGEKVQATITSKGVEGVGNYDSIEMELLKKDNENCWLWSQENNLGVLIFYIP